MKLCLFGFVILLQKDNKQTKKMSENSIASTIVSTNRAKIVHKDIWYASFSCATTLVLVLVYLGLPMTPLFESMPLAYATLGLSILLLLQFPSDLTKHTCVLAYITTFQLLHVHQPHFALPLKTLAVEAGTGVVVVLILALEHVLAYYVIRSTRRDEAIPETCRDILGTDSFRLYGAKIANIVLLCMALIPHSNINVFLLEPAYKLLLIAVWMAFACTEAYKAFYLATYGSTDGISIPCKCAPILYLPYYYWGVVAAFVCMNIVTIYYGVTKARGERKTDP